MFNKVDCTIYTKKLPVVNIMRPMLSALALCITALTDQCGNKTTGEKCLTFNFLRLKQYSEVTEPNVRKMLHNVQK